MSLLGIFKFFAREPEISLGGLLEVKVKKVWDGDTFTFFTSSAEIYVRLDSIDCPEGDQPWGDIAKAGLIKLIGGRYVYLETHGMDSHKRTLATVYVMEDSELVNVNEKLVMRGHAWVYHEYFGHLSKVRRHRLNSLERFARFNRVGLWRTDNPIPPWHWRK